MINKTVMDAVNDIDWSQAPEGATHYVPEGDGFSEAWVKDVSDDSYKYVRVDGKEGKNWQSTNPIHHNELKGIVEKPTQPVFTQAMADNGELPQVGMECMILNTNCSRPKYIKGLIKYVGDLVIYAYIENGERCDNVKTLKFKPIDTRTDKEKAIDKFIDEVFGAGELIDRKLLSLAYDKWVGE